MKYIRTIFILAVAFLFAGCGEQPTSPTIVTGLPPVAWIANEIAGTKHISVSLLPEGRNPHDYTPGPALLRRASGAKLFLSCGMPFENIASKALRCRTVDVTQGIEKIMFDTHGKAHHHHHHHHEGEACSDDGSDPHVWLSCRNSIVIAENIARALSEIDPANKELYEKNLSNFRLRAIELENQLKKQLSPYSGRTFFVYHPAFGYFAKEFGLVQQSIELSGRETSAARMAEVIKLAKKENVKVIFTQKEFNPRSSEMLAREINGKCVQMDVLAFDVFALIKSMADSIVAGFGGQGK